MEKINTDPVISVSQHPSGHGQHLRKGKNAKRNELRAEALSCGSPAG